MENNVNFKSIIRESRINHGYVSQQFGLGQEIEFCNFLREWYENLKNDLDNKTGEFVYYDLSLRNVVTNSLNNLDWQLIWNKLNKEIITSTHPYISGCIRTFIYRIKDFINHDTFIEKINSCDDITSVYFLYALYFNEINEFKIEYIKYLSSFVERNNCSYEDCLKKLYMDFKTINNRDFGINKIFNFNRNNDTDLKKLIDLFLEIPCIENIETDENYVIFEYKAGKVKSK